MTCAVLEGPIGNDGRAGVEVDSREEYDEDDDVLLTESTPALCLRVATHEAAELTDEEARTCPCTRAYR